ncbi:MAG: hypothetical protein H7Z37_10015 [Pyrinomonadaceae bacterium]|nr:hypothetical protein [Pyrinomonadaceae bacterium]
MFQVKAGYGEQITIKTTTAKVREFFADVRNFMSMMPNIESILTDSQGVTRWKIRADIPIIGSMDEVFNVVLSENTPNLIEWTPAKVESKNFLRYSADFVEKSATETLVQISQAVELRREKASDLHFLAGLAGEKMISQQMQSRVEKMIKDFLENARKTLEKV